MSLPERRRADAPFGGDAVGSSGIGGRCFRVGDFVDEKLAALSPLPPLLLPTLSPLLPPWPPPLASAAAA